MNFGLEIKDKKDLVGICYTMWFNCIFGNDDEPIENVRNVTELCKEYTFTTKNGFMNDKGETKNDSPYFHFWAKPAQGYYRSTDKNAHVNSLRLLQKAGVDFLVLDYTYASVNGGWGPGTDSWNTYIGGPLTVLLDAIVELRENGEKTPYILLWPNDSSMFEPLLDNFILKDKWKDCFVYWDGKPFILNWYDRGETYRDDVTVRSMYGLQRKLHTNRQWSYLEHDNTLTIGRNEKGEAEHMTTCVAAQLNYMSFTDCAQGRDGGRFWNKQWRNAFEVHPKIVTVTWWNEWAAQLLPIEGWGYGFTDNFNRDYSRDIEPMEGGHGDLYYRWLCEYVRAYKNHEACPTLTED